MRGRTTLGVCLLLAAAASAQVRVAGRITNETSAPVAGARITASSEKFPKSFEATSDPTGEFVLMLPEAGAYSLKIDREGFYVHSEPTVMLPAELHIVLQTIHEIRSSADVKESPGMVDMDRTTPQNTLSSRTLYDIPFPNQNSLRSGLRMIPGVVQDSVGGLHLFGGSESQAQYTFEGFQLNDPLTGRFDARMSLESVQSVDVAASQSGAEFGRGAAGTMAIHARTGGDAVKYSATNVFPGFDTGRGVRIGSWTPRGNVSGPWWRGRAWYFNTVELQYSSTLVPELPPGSDRSKTWRASDLLHNQINLSPRNNLFVGVLFNYFLAPRSGLTYLDPRETTIDRRSNQWFGYVKDQHSFSRSSLIEFGFAASRTFSREIPQGTSPYLISPNGRLGNSYANAQREAQRDQALINFFLPSFTLLGTHQLKTGTDVLHVDYEQNIQRTAIEFLGLGGVLLRQIDFLGSGRLSRANLENSIYAQDAWRVRPSLLVEMGWRTDRDRILNHWNVSPRVGFGWSPPGMESLRISGGFARIFDPTDLRLFTRPLDQTTSTMYFDSTGHPIDGPLLSVYSIGPNVRNPRADIWNMGAERRLPKLITAKFQWLRRRSSRGFDYVSSLSPNSNVTAYELSNDRQDKYDSFEIALRQPLKGRYDWMVSYTRSRAVSNAVIERSIDQPLMIGMDTGPLPWNAPNRLLSWGYLPTWRKNWAVAYLLDWHNGFPFSVQDQYGRLVGNVDDHHFNQFFELNLFIERQITVRGYRLAVRAGFNNITGHQNSNVVENVVGSPTYLSQFGGQSRALNLRLRFLGRM